MFSPHDFELCQSMLYHLYWICVIYEVDHDHILFYWLSILFILLSMWNLLVNLYLWTCLCLCTCLCYYRCLCESCLWKKRISLWWQPAVKSAWEVLMPWHLQVPGHQKPPCWVLLVCVIENSFFLFKKKKKKKKKNCFQVWRGPSRLGGELHSEPL